MVALQTPVGTHPTVLHHRIPHDVLRSTQHLHLFLILTHSFTSGCPSPQVYPTFPTFSIGQWQASNPTAASPTGGGHSRCAEVCWAKGMPAFCPWSCSTCACTIQVQSTRLAPAPILHTQIVLQLVLATNLKETMQLDQALDVINSALQVSLSTPPT